MYMSYCRQEGTFSELRVCLNDVDEHVSEVAEYAVSEREIENFREMVEYFFDWCGQMALINENGELDHDGLDEVCEAMAKSYGEEEG